MSSESATTTSGLAFVKFAFSGRHRFVTGIAMLAAIGGFLFGYDTGIVSQALPYIAKEFHASAFEQSWIVASLLLGAVVGAIGSGYLSDRISRKWTKCLSGCVYVVAAIAAAFAQDVIWLCLARFVLGFAVGTAGRLTAQKSLGDALLAVARIPDVELLVLGDGPELGALGRQASSLGISERVRFLGYDQANVKIVAYVVSAALAGIAGALFVPIAGIISPSAVGVVPSIAFITGVALGGRATLLGPAIGAIAVGWAQNQLSSEFPSFWTYFQGALFVVVVAVLPGGLGQLPGLAGGVLGRIGRGRRTPVLPSRAAQPSASKPVEVPAHE